MYTLSLSPPLPAGLDFDLPSRHLTLDGASDHVCTSFTAIDDSSIEAEEAFTLTLSTNDPAILFNRTSVTVVIEDNDQVTVGMMRESYEVAEEDGTVEVCVQLSGTTEKDIVVNIFTEDGTALGKRVCVCVSMLILGQC